MINIPHLLLAAGTSKRMGEPKQLLNCILNENGGMLDGMLTGC